jgi:hypothetical protein
MIGGEEDRTWTWDEEESIDDFAGVNMDREEIGVC